MQIQTQALGSPRHTVLWTSVLALAVLYGAFTLSWVIYRVQLPQMGKQFGFAETFAPTVLLIDALMAVFLEPFSGRLADRDQQRRSNRFPVIFLGTGISALLFLLLIGLLAFVSPQSGLGWMIPLSLIAWGAAMSVFRSPALAMLRQYATPRLLPQAASAMTLAAGLMGATAPLAGPLFVQLGVPITFVACAVLLVVSALVLRALNSEIPVNRESITQTDLVFRVEVIFALGLATTFALRLVVETLPKILKAQVPTVNPPLMLGAVFLTVALAAFPAGALAVRWGNRRVMLVGIAGMAACFAMMASIPNAAIALLLAVGFGVSFSLFSNGTLPLVMTMLAARNAGLAVGMFFGGASLATALFGLFTPFLTTPSAWSPTVLGWVALTIAALCIALSFRSSRREYA